MSVKKLSSNMRYFDSGNRLSMDTCAVQAKDNENESIVYYNTFNFFTNGDTSCGGAASKAREMILEYPNMRFRTGYGVADGCVIDADSTVRNASQNLREKEHQQLCPRIFQAVPNLGRGTVVPNLESMLMQGIDTGALRDCHRIAEVPYFQPVPLTPCMTGFLRAEAEAIPSIHSIGQPSKDIFLQHRKACRSTAK